jgi:hypothetical protein
MDKLKEQVGAVAAALSLIGVLAFAAQHIAYERFYDQFGLAPEDLGLDFTRVVQQTAGGIGIFSALAIVITGFTTGLATLLARHRKQMNVRLPLVLGLSVASFYLLLVLWTNLADADDAAKCAARPDGRPVRGLRTHLAGLLVTKLAVRADRAVLHSTNPKDPSAERWAERPLVYLGTANGTVFAYDPGAGARRTIRVPTASVIVSVDTTTPRYSKQDGCDRPQLRRP